MLLTVWLTNTYEHIRFWLPIAAVLALAAALHTLGIILCREWVKRDLYDRVCRPMRIRWNPLWSTRFSCSFKVTYVDYGGLIHRAQCWTPWLGRRVVWETDEVIGIVEREISS